MCNSPQSIPLIAPEEGTGPKESDSPAECHPLASKAKRRAERSHENFTQLPHPNK